MITIFFQIWIFYIDMMIEFQNWLPICYPDFNPDRNELVRFDQDLKETDQQKDSFDSSSLNVEMSEYGSQE